MVEEELRVIWHRRKRITLPRKECLALKYCKALGALKIPSNERLQGGHLHSLRLGTLVVTMWSSFHTPSHTSGPNKAIGRFTAGRGTHKASGKLVYASSPSGAWTLSTVSVSRDLNDNVSRATKDDESRRGQATQITRAMAWLPIALKKGGKIQASAVIENHVLRKRVRCATNKTRNR